MQPDNKLIGANGCKYIDGAVTSEKFYMLVVNTDAVFTVLTGEDTTNYLTSIGLSGKTVSQGTVITIAKGESFASVTVTSGSVIGYNGS